MYKYLTTLAFAVAATLSSCQTKKYPALDTEVMVYTDADYDKKYFDDFSIYKKATTKSKAVAPPKENDIPWQKTISETVANDIVNQIDKNLIVVSDEAAGFTKSPSRQVIFSTQLMFSSDVRSVYEKEEKLPLKEVIMQHLKGIILDHKLVNEKNEAIHLPNDELTISLYNSTDDGNNLSSEFFFKTSTLGLAEYLNLVGFIDIEIEMVVTYELKMIDKNSIGSIIEFNDQKVEILEFDENVIHYKTEGDRNFEVFLDGCNNDNSSVGIPAVVYEKFRENQGLDYNTFIEKRNVFGIDNIDQSKNVNWVSIIKCDEYALKNVFFYHPAKVIKKRIRVPVTIKTTQ